MDTLYIFLINTINCFNSLCEFFSNIDSHEILIFLFQDLFFKYSLNNFLHEQVKECIRLVFAWNNSVLPPNEAPKSPTAVRVKTPPTVEMIDPTNEEGEKNEGVEKTDDKNILDDVQAEKKQKTSDSSEDLNQDTVEKTESNENEEDNISSH